MDVKVQLQTRNVTSGDLVVRTYNYVNRDYVGQLPVGSAPAPTPDLLLPSAYTSFWAWVEAVGRGLTSLSANTYVDSGVVASWSVNEEEAG